MQKQTIFTYISNQQLLVKMVEWRGQNILMCYITLNLMNFHKNSMPSRMLDPLREHYQSNKDEKQLYQSMFAKQFQIIQTFLQKINELYNKNQDFEHSICQLQEKIERLETTTKNVHYEFRTTHLMIDKKLNTMNNDYNHMQEQVKTIQMERPIDKYLSSKHFIKNIHHMKTRNKKSKGTKKHKDSQQSYKIAILSGNQINITSPGVLQNVVDSGSQAINKGQNNEGYGQNNTKIIGFADENIKNSLTRNIDKIGSISSLNSIVNISPSIKMLNEQQEDFDSEEYSQNSIRIDYQFVQNAIATLNQKIQQKIVEQITKVKVQNQQKNASFLKQLITLQEKMITQSQLDQLGASLRQQLQSKITAARQQFGVSLVCIKHELFEYNKTLLAELEQNEKKIISQKVEIPFFEESMNNLTNSINQQIAKQERNFANKIQTKKAIDFLEVKLNRFITQEFNIVKSKRNMYLKVNKYDSNKKLELLSEKSMKDIKDKLDQSQMKSLETSMHIIDEKGSPKQAQNKLNRVASQLITWKKPHLTASAHIETSQQDFKPLRSSSQESPELSASVDFKRLQKKISKKPQEPTVNLKEWREKVIKVLKKEDRRKRKVTFR